jgi:Fe-S cluster assembly iron-binding protein IscA
MWIRGSGMFIRCNYCHKLVLRWFLESHTQRHKKRQPDGQMAEHVTRAPNERYAGSLDDVPQAYRHERCGVVTGMPEEIIRSYLIDPLMYSDRSFCCGCGDYINSAYLTWVETGEAVMDYLGRLRRRFLREEYDMDLSKRPKGIIMTKEARQGIRSIVKQNGITAFYFGLQITGEGELAQYAADLRPDFDFDSDSEKIKVVSGIDVVVRKDQIAKMDGTVIHFKTAGGESGFVISRLYAHC